MIKSFHLAAFPKIYFGIGAINKTAPLVKNYGDSTVLITGNSFFNRGDKGNELLNELEVRNIRTSIYTICKEPTTKDVDDITSDLRQNPPSSIIAIGGGSVIDTGKAISAMTSTTGKVWDYMEGNPVMKQHSGKTLPFIAIPTTAGTGSEATKNAVITTIANPVLKRSLRNDSFVPDIAIIDPELAISCPPHIISASGLDAISQLLEAYLSTQASPATDALAYSGLEKAIKSIYNAVKTKSINSMTDMSYAALISGIVLANAGLGAVHGLAAVIGSHFDIPHGVICGNLIGAVNRKNISKLQLSDNDNFYLKKYVRVGKLISNENNKNDDYYLHFAADKLDELVENLNITRFGQYGITKEHIAALAKETGLKNNPVNLSLSELENIINSRI